MVTLDTNVCVRYLTNDDELQAHRATVDGMGLARSVGC